MSTRPDDSVPVWLRGFASEDERDKLYATVCEDERCKTSISPRIIQVRRIVPTSRSALQ